MPVAELTAPAGFQACTEGASEHSPRSYGGTAEAHQYTRSNPNASPGDLPRCPILEVRERCANGVQTNKPCGFSVPQLLYL